jgi:hypothetical protein
MRHYVGRITIEMPAMAQSDGDPAYTPEEKVAVWRQWANDVIARVRAAGGPR